MVMYVIDTRDIPDIRYYVLDKGAIDPIDVSDTRNYSLS